MALPWWEREKMLTDKDRAAIDEAKKQDWTEIKNVTAETPAGRIEIKSIKFRKYCREEYAAGME